MKSFKLLLLLGLLTVTACKTEDNQSNTNSNETTNNTEVTNKDSENNNNESTTPDNNNENSSEENSNNNEENTSTENENNNTEENNENGNSTEDTPNSNTKEEVSYKINLYNPSCGTFSKETLNERLKAYINGEAKIDLVSSIKGSNCQLGANFPTTGNSVLVVGSSGSAGSLEFTFTKTVKKISVTAQTYHKPYVETWNDNREVANVDPNSALTIYTDGASPVFNLDLKPEEDNPVEKTMDIEINNTTLTLSSVTDNNGRVYIKEITFVL